MGIASAAATPTDPSSHSPVPSILAIETSCDETAAAVMRVDGVLLSSVLYSQHDVHQRYGGVVPELAARRHIETVESVVAQSMAQAHIEWSDVQAVAVTSGPGLAGALLVGVNMTQALAGLEAIVLAERIRTKRLDLQWLEENFLRDKELHSRSGEDLSQ